MSWHFLQEQEEASWEGSSWDGAPSVLLRLIPTAERCSLHGNATDACRVFLSGTMSAHSMVLGGAEPSMSSAQDSLARTQAAPEFANQDLASMERARVCGERRRASLMKYGLKASFWKTPRTYGPAASLKSSVHLPSSGMTLSGECWGLGTSAPRTDATVFGSWPTTTTTRGTEHAPSMLKWPAHRKMFATLAAHLYGNNVGGAAGRTGKVRESFERDVGMFSLTLREWMMGWPIGWTELQPLATDRFQEWLRWHGRR